MLFRSVSQSRYNHTCSQRRDDFNQPEQTITKKEQNKQMNTVLEQIAPQAAREYREKVDPQHQRKYSPAKAQAFAREMVDQSFHGIRKDGRVFSGIIIDLWSWSNDPARGQLVVIRQSDGKIKSVYLHDLISYSASNWVCPS